MISPAAIGRFQALSKPLAVAITPCLAVHTLRLLASGSSSSSWAPREAERLLQQLQFPLDAVQAYTDEVARLHHKPLPLSGTITMSEAVTHLPTRNRCTPQCLAPARLGSTPLQHHRGSSSGSHLPCCWH
jgi:hypothetical protein